MQKDEGYEFQMSLKKLIIHLFSYITVSVLFEDASALERYKRGIEYTIHVLRFQHRRQENKNTYDDKIFHSSMSISIYLYTINS